MTNQIQNSKFKKFGIEALIMDWNFGLSHLDFKFVCSITCFAVNKNPLAGVRLLLIN